MIEIFKNLLVIVQEQMLTTLTETELLGQFLETLLAFIVADDQLIAGQQPPGDKARW